MLWIRNRLKGKKVIFMINIICIYFIFYTVTRIIMFIMFKFATKNNGYIPPGIGMLFLISLIPVLGEIVIAWVLIATLVFELRSFS